MAFLEAGVTHIHATSSTHSSCCRANFAPHRAGDSAGNNEFLTPNLAALAKNGTLLNRFYGHKFCGPSRAAIQSGRLPIHVTVLDNPLPSVNPKDPDGGFQGIPCVSQVS